MKTNVHFRPDLGFRWRNVLESSYLIFQALTVENLSFIDVILNSNFRRVLNVVCCLLGDSPANEIYMPKFRNPLSVPSS